MKHVAFSTPFELSSMAHYMAVYPECFNLGTDQYQYPVLCLFSIGSETGFVRFMKNSQVPGYKTGTCCAPTYDTAESTISCLLFSMSLSPMKEQIDPQGDDGGQDRHLRKNLVVIKLREYQKI